MNLFVTNQLIIRQFNESDAPAFYALNSHSGVMRYIRPVKNEEECKAFLQENIRLYTDQSVIGRYYVAEKTSQAFVGTFSVLMMPDRDAYHIGYALMPWAQGRGWAKELVKAGIEWFFSHSTQTILYAITEQLNAASVAVLQKTGFSFLETIEQRDILLDVFHISKKA